MKASSIIRLAALAATLGSAMAAHAIDITIASVGTYNNVGPAFTFNEHVVYQASGPLAAFDSVTLHVNATTGAGTALFSNVAATQTMLIRYSLTGFGGNLPFISASGGWNYVSGTGSYAHKTGSGSLTQNVFLGGGSSISTFKGDLQAVPEPASMAALGVGAVGLLRRRRKA